MRIAIIGGGIGGLTTAVVLRQLGFEPQVFEQAPNILGVGAAILMWPNAMRVLHRLGLAETIRKHGGLLENGCWLTHQGRILKRFRFPATEVPAIALHRAELQHALLEALPEDSVHLDHSFKAYEQRPGALAAHFNNQPSFECDLLIGADGIHSHVREQMLRDGGPANHSYLAWRGIVPYTPASVPAATSVEIYGPGQRFGIGPLSSEKLGWWASTNRMVESADALTMRNELLKLFAGWCEPVTELIEATPLTSIIRNPVCDRLPTKQWSSGAVVLLGDAVHPTTPNLGQGGCLAIEDAVVLARCVHKYSSNLSDALRRFASLRYPRTTAIARYSRVYGKIGQWDQAAAVRLRRDIQSLIPSQLVQNFLRRIFDYDAYGLNV